MHFLSIDADYARNRQFTIEFCRDRQKHTLLASRPRENYNGCHMRGMVLCRVDGIGKEIRLTGNAFPVKPGYSHVTQSVPREAIDGKSEVSKCSYKCRDVDAKIHFAYLKK